MYEEPPPYPGIGPNRSPNNIGFTNPSPIGFVQTPTYNQIPSYNQATELPSKQKFE